MVQRRQDRHFSFHLRRVLRHRPLDHGRQTRDRHTGRLCTLDGGAAGGRRSRASRRRAVPLARLLRLPYAGLDGARARLARRLWQRGASDRGNDADRRRGLFARLHLGAGLHPGRRLSADHAEFHGLGERRPDRRARRLYQIADHGPGSGSLGCIAAIVLVHGSTAMTDATLPFVPPLESYEESYLDEGHTILSWLTTTDH